MQGCGSMCRFRMLGTPLYPNCNVEEKRQRMIMECTLCYIQRNNIRIQLASSVLNNYTSFDLVRDDYKKCNTR